MNSLKKIISSLLFISIIVSMCACHGKDETALTIDGIQISSALYLNALLESDSAARSKVDSDESEKASSNTSSSASTSSEGTTDYYSKTVDGKKYVDYVKEQAIKKCKEYAFYQKLVNDKKISLTEEKLTEAENAAKSYWDYYGYSTVFEPNGISYDTYKKAFTYSYYSNEYFMSIYGEKGSSAVSKSDILKTLTEKYALVYTLSSSYDENTTSAEKQSTEEKFANYEKRLKKGESFSKISEEYNGKSSNGTVDVSEESSQSAAKDKLATIIGDSDTSYSNDNFKDISAMKKGEVKIIKASDGSKVELYVKLDITEDPYYLSSLNDSILYILKQDEFTANVEKQLEAMTVKENGYAIGRLKVKKITYPTSQQNG